MTKRSGPILIEIIFLENLAPHLSVFSIDYNMM